MFATTEIVGRISLEPKLFQNDDGTKKRIIFTVATNTVVNGKNKANFYPCVIWGDKRVPNLLPWMKVGRIVHVRGDLSTYIIKNEDGTFKSKNFEIVVKDFEFVDKKPKDIEVPTKKEDALALMQKIVQQFAEGTPEKSVTECLSETVDSGEDYEDYNGDEYYMSS